MPVRLTVKCALRDDVRTMRGYITHPKSRFAVVGWPNPTGASGKRWGITHIASGLGVESLLPHERRCDDWTCRALLSIVANWEGQGWDLSPLDDVVFGVGFRNRSDPRLRALFDDMRRSASMEPA